MKKIMSVAVGIIFVATSASAVLPPVGYIGLFKDDTHNTDPAANAVCPAMFTQFVCWVWCLPSQHGLHGTAFDVSLPSEVVIVNTVQNPLIDVVLGVIGEGVIVQFGDDACQMDWVWTHQLTMTAVTTTPSKIEIIPYPGTIPAAYRFMTCEPGYPNEPCIYLTPLYFCWSPDPGPLGVKESSWGAIKSLY